MKMLRSKGCAELFGIHHTTWEKWVELDPTAPQPVVKSRGWVTWAEADVLAYQELLIKEGRSGYVKKTA